LVLIPKAVAEVGTSCLHSIVFTFFIFKTNKNQDTAKNETNINQTLRIDCFFVVENEIPRLVAS